MAAFLFLGSRRSSLDTIDSRESTCGDGGVFAGAFLIMLCRRYLAQGTFPALCTFNALSLSLRTPLSARPSPALPLQAASRANCRGHALNCDCELFFSEKLEVKWHQMFLSVTRGKDPKIRVYPWESKEKKSRGRSPISNNQQPPIALPHLPLGAPIYQ